MKFMFIKFFFWINFRCAGSLNVAVFVTVVVAVVVVVSIAVTSASAANKTWIF